MTSHPARQIAVQHASPTIAGRASGGAPTPQTPFEINLGDMFKSVWRRRWTIITFVILGMLVGLVAALMTVSTFTSESRVILEERRNEVLDSNVVTGFTLSDETVETEIEVVASRDIKLRIVQELNLQNILSERQRESERQSLGGRLHWFVSDWLAQRRQALGMLLPADLVTAITAPPELSEPVDFDGAVRFLNETMEPRQAGNTSVVVVKVTDRDAQLAANIANATAKVYLERQLEWKANETGGASRFLEERIADLNAELGSKRAQLQTLRNATGDVGTTGGTLLAQRRLLSNQRLLDARNERIKLETTLEQISGVLNADDPAAISIMVNTPLMVQLRADQSLARQQLAELANDFGERHPRNVEARSRLVEIEDNIQSEARRHVSALQTELRAARREEVLLQSDLSSQNAEDQALDEDRTAAEALRSEINTIQTLLDDFTTRFKEADEARAVLRPDARIISEAVPNDYADFPNRKIILAGSIAIFGILGVIAAFIRDGTDRSMRSIHSAEAALNVPVLGLIPVLAGRFRLWHPVEYVSKYPTTAFSESIRAVFTSLGLRPHQDKGQILLVTSALPGEGKSSTVAAMGHQIARAGLKAIIIECDLRRPSLASSLRSRAKPGLIQMLQGEIDVGDGIQTDTHYGMDLITSGGTSENSLFMFQSDAMRQLLDQLTRSHDMIILDSPPVIALPDAQVLAEHANSILYLCRWGKTPRETAAAGIRMLVRQGGTLVMSALTQVDMKRYATYDQAYGDPSIERYYVH